MWKIQLEIKRLDKPLAKGFLVRLRLLEMTEVVTSL